MQTFTCSVFDTARRSILGILQRELPLSFSLTPKPLAHSVKPSLLDYYQSETRFTQQALLKALKDHPHSEAYLQALIAGAPRVDLWGKPVSFVTLKEAQQANAILAIRNTRFDVTTDDEHSTPISKHESSRSLAAAYLAACLC